MPALTRWYLKTALLCLVLALLTGILQAIQAIWQVSWLASSQRTFTCSWSAGSRT